MIEVQESAMNILFDTRFFMDEINIDHTFYKWI